MKRPVVALVINYRDAIRTAECVRRLLDGDIVHVIVWDNSADRGVSAAELCILFADNSRVSLKINPLNLGFAAGVNRGIEACCQLMPEAWVLLINNDAVAPKDLAGALSGALQQNASTKIAFPALIHAGRRIDEVFYQRWLGLILSRPKFGAFRLPRGCCLMLATDRWTGPLFDEDFFMYGEEIELGWRLHTHPAAMVYVGETIVVHEGSASSGINSLFYETRMVAAHLILVRKLGRNCVETLLLYLMKVPVLSGRAGLRSVRCRSLTPWRALWRGVRLAVSQGSNIGPPSSDPLG